MRYFKTSIPNTKLLLTTGAYVAWEKVDEQNGVIQTDDPSMAAQFVSAIQRQVGGVVEIDKAEYDDLKKKQGETPLSKPWREEFGPGAMNQAANRLRNVSAAEVEKPKMQSVTVQAAPQSRAKGSQTIERPKSIKR